MRQRAQIGFGLLAVIAAGMTLSAAWPAALPASDSDRDDGKHSEVPLTAQQVHDLVNQAIENQRRNDLLLDQYARTQHSWFHGSNKEPEKNVIYRVIPAGDGIIQVELERDGKTSDAAYLEQQWHGVAQALLAEAHGRQPHLGNLHYRERARERSDMVTAIGKAFIFRWAGRASIGGRPVVRLTFEPDPTYRSPARFAPLYAHSRGTAWVDESSAQLIQAEAELTDDVSWAGGLIAKFYRGGKFTYEQREVAPGLWLPTGYAYDFDGRKFFFSNLSVHERMKISDYSRIGPPEEALAVIRREHPTVFGNQN